MTNRKQLRFFARKTYSEHKKDIIPAALLCAAVTVVLTVLSEVVLTMARGLTSESSISFLVSLIILLINAPLSFGLMSLLVKFTRDAEARWSDIFLWLGELRRIKASVVGQVWYGMLCGMWVFLYSMAGFCLFAFGLGGQSVIIMLLGAVLSFAGILLAVLKCLCHMPGMYILADNPKAPIIMSFNLAGLVMKYRKKEMAKTVLGFIPWFIPYLVLMIPSMWITGAQTHNAISQAAYELSMVTEVVTVAVPDMIWYYISMAASTIYVSLLMPYVHLTCIRLFNTAFGEHQAKYTVPMGEDKNNE